MFKKTYNYFNILIYNKINLLYFVVQAQIKNKKSTNGSQNEDIKKA